MARSHVVLSWNVRGLSSGVKSLAVSHVAKRLRSSILRLQETHMHTDQSMQFSARLFSQQFHPVYSSFSRGVSILIPQGTPFTCMHSVIDKGRYIFLRCNVEGLECILANVYIPPPFSAEVPNILAGFLARHPNVPALVLGDFNNYLNPQLDKFSMTHPDRFRTCGPTPFAHLLTVMGLMSGD